MERIQRLGDARGQTAEPLRVVTLSGLDALVGRHIMGETPRTHWVDARAFLRFDSRDEAIEAIRHPNYRRFVSDADWMTGAVRKVETFKPYSSDLTAAWEIVEILANSKEFALHLRQEDDLWIARFDEASEAWHESAPVAICLAALRARGVDFVLDAAIS